MYPVLNVANVYSLLNVSKSPTVQWYLKLSSIGWFSNYNLIYNHDDGRHPAVTGNYRSKQRGRGTTFWLNVCKLGSLHARFKILEISFITKYVINHSLVGVFFLVFWIQCFFHSCPSVNFQNSMLSDWKLESLDIQYLESTRYHLFIWITRHVQSQGCHLNVFHLFQCFFPSLSLFRNRVCECAPAYVCLAFLLFIIQPHQHDH